MEEVPAGAFKESRHKVGDYYKAKFSAHQPSASLEVSRTFRVLSAHSDPSAQAQNKRKNTQRLQRNHYWS